jgi:hypothetical protein
MRLVPVLVFRHRAHARHALVRQFGQIYVVVRAGS